MWIKTSAEKTLMHSLNFVPTPIIKLLVIMKHAMIDVKLC